MGKAKMKKRPNKAALNFFQKCNDESVRRSNGRWVDAMARVLPGPFHDEPRFKK